VSRYIPWLIIAVAAITLVGLNANGLQTVALLIFLVGAGLARAFNRQWPKNILLDIALVVLGPIVIITVARLLFTNVQIQNDRMGALLMLVILVLLFGRRLRRGGRRLLD
jgi:hypothetical protein